MKELSIEEKAKAYDELKVKASQIYNKENDVLIMHTIEDLFPELKENEDERISREITDFICWATDKGCITREQLERSNCWLAWLDKQGEQKLPDKIQIGQQYQCVASPIYTTFRIGEIYKPENEFLRSLMNFCSECFKPVNSEKDFLPKQASPVLSNSSNVGKVEPKPAELPKGEDYGIDGLWHAINILQRTLGEVEGYQSDDGILEHKCAISAVKELYERRLVWSEEDEIVLNNLIYALANDRIENDRDEYVDWLKYLKDKV